VENKINKEQPNSEEYHFATKSLMLKFSLMHYYKPKPKYTKHTIITNGKVESSKHEYRKLVPLASSRDYYKPRRKAERNTYHN
jgi:hypothetical protein